MMAAQMLAAAAAAPAQPQLATPWFLALAYATAGAVISLTIGRLLKVRDDRRVEYTTLRMNGAAVKMLISAVENTSHQFPTSGYDRQVFDRTFDLLLQRDSVGVVERFDEKFFWRLGYVEQVVALANRYIALRDEALTHAKPRIDVAPDEWLLPELHRLNDECRKGLYEALELLESSGKSGRYRWVR